MIMYRSTPWKNTVAFRVSFDLRNLNIHQTHPALLHFAEHLMFVATKKYKEQTLYERKTFFFDFLGAFTTPINLCINVTCAQTDLKKVIETLHEMIYSWTCTAKQFAKEKAEILTELAEYESDATTKAVNSLSTKDPEFKTIAIGNKKTLSALKYSDLKKIKEAWKIVLDQAPASLIVASGSLSSAEKKTLENIANFRKPPITIPTTPAPVRILTVPGAQALQFKATNGSPFYLLLQRLYFTRHTQTDPNWFLEFVHEKNSLTYLTFKKSSGVFNIQASKKFLTSPPTKVEFEIARTITLKHLGSLQDGLDPQELIDWLDTFQDIPQTKNKNLVQISKLFTSHTFKTFLKEWHQNFKKLKI